MFEWVEGEGRYAAVHHPFTLPTLPERGARGAARAGALSREEMDGLTSQAYDLVYNGVEVGGGSIRIHTRALQEAVLQAIGMSPQEARAQFGFLLDALELGAPPHGGAMRCGWGRVEEEGGSRERCAGERGHGAGGVMLATAAILPALESSQAHQPGLV